MLNKEDADALVALHNLAPALIRAARARLDAPADREGVWQPVESAPKDGTRFVTYIPGTKYPYDFAVWLADEECFCKDDCGWHRVTHWMPLRAPALARGDHAGGE